MYKDWYKKVLEQYKLFDDLEFGYKSQEYIEK